MDRSPDVAVAAIIKTAITGQGWSIAELARKSGVPYATLHRNIHHPEAHSFKLRQLEKIAEQLGTTVSAMFAQADEATAA